MLTANLIAKKRDGHELSRAEIEFLVGGFARGDVADYQMSAFAMAVCTRGMSEDETAALTLAMLESGERLPRSDDRPRVDKHSTGGLGDKVSLILAPLLAACDVDVPMISGRGLGRTGGTLDKLEAIPGFRAELSVDESSRVLRDVHAFIVSASERIAPADRKLYRLRDVTGTVESIPLITASILSKKVAATLDALVMDVKLGSAAFMKDAEQATRLASSLIRVGKQAGLPTQALITDMDQPLGLAVGNAIEVNEALETLEGGGPLEVRQLTLDLCAPLLVQVGIETTLESAMVRLTAQLDSGAARECFDRMVRAQGGDLRGPLPLESPTDLVADRPGFVASIDNALLADTVIRMGGGRKVMTDRIDPSVGLAVHVRIGQKVEKGDPLLTLHAPPQDHSGYLGALSDTIRLVESPVARRPLVLASMTETNAWIQTSGT